MLVQVSRVAVDFGMLILIWLVQLIIYPSFEYSAREGFEQWHEKYTGMITLVVLPLMLAQISLAIWQIYDGDRGWETLTAFGLIVFCWLVTFALSVPAHNQLQELGNDLDTVRWLVLTNWLRTIGWTAVSLLSIKQFYEMYNATQLGQ